MCGVAHTAQRISRSPGATAQTQSWWHISQFILAEVDGRLDLARPPITVTIDGREAARTTGNSGGDPLRLLTALADHCARRTGGLHKGDMITTGSITGVAFASPGATVIADFGPLGTVRLEFPL